MYLNTHWTDSMFRAILRCHTGQQVQHNLPQVKATFVENKVLCILVLGFPQWFPNSYSRTPLPHEKCF